MTKPKEADDSELLQVPHEFVWCDKKECVCFWPACWAHGCMAVDGEAGLKENG